MRSHREVEIYSVLENFANNLANNFGWIDYSELVKANTINSRVKNIWLGLVSGRVSYKNRTIRYYWKFSNKTCLNAFT